MQIFYIQIHIVIIKLVKKESKLKIHLFKKNKMLKYSNKFVMFSFLKKENEFQSIARKKNIILLLGESIF